MFGRAFALLRRNPSIAVPGLAIALVLTIVRVALAPADPLDDDLVHRAADLIATVLATIVSIAYTTGMADAAWRSGRATLSDGARAFRRDGSHVLVATVALSALGVIAAILAAFTFGLSILVYTFFCIYTMAAAVSGERPGLVAVAESAEIAFSRPLPTLGVVLGVGLVALAIGAVAELVARTPYVGPLLSSVAVQFVVAYAVLVIVGEYRVLRPGGVPV